MKARHDINVIKHYRYGTVVMMVPLAISDSGKVSKRVYEDLIMIGGNLAKIKPSTG